MFTGETYLLGFFCFFEKNTGRSIGGIKNELKNLTTVDYLMMERFMSINMKIPTFIRLQKCLLITENIS